MQNWLCFNSFFVWISVDVLCTFSFSITAPLGVFANVHHHDFSPYSALTHPYENGVSAATENIRDSFRQALQVVTDQFAERDEHNQVKKERRGTDAKRVLPKELSSSRYGREAVQVADKYQGNKRKASFQKRADAVSGCNAVGIRYDLSTTPLHNCSGSLIPTSEFNDFYSNRACQNCVGINSTTTCQRRCCRPAVIAKPDAVLCRCPADFSGNQCENLRPWSCAVNYISPGNLDCSSPSAPIGTDVYGRDDCYKFSRGNASTVFLFNATCSQVDPLLDQGFEMAQFVYYVKTSKLALTKDPAITIMGRIANFHRISDLSQARQVYMSPDMYTGYQQYGFWYNLTELTLDGSPFFFGGRLYMEAEFQTKDSSQPDFLDKEGIFRTYIDFYDIPRMDSSQIQKAYLGGLGPVGIALVSVACLIVVVSTAVFLHLRAKKMKED